MCLCHHPAVFKETMNLNDFLLPLLQRGLQGECDDQLTRGEGVISGQVASLVQAHIEKQTTIHTRTQPQNLKFPNRPHLHVFGVWKGARELEEHPHWNRGKIQTPHRVWVQTHNLYAMRRHLWPCRPITFTTHLVVCVTMSMKNKTWDTLLWVNDSVLVALVFYTYLLWLSAIQ